MHRVCYVEIGGRVQVTCTQCQYRIIEEGVLPLVSNTVHCVVALTVPGRMPPTCCAIMGISHVQARSVSNGNEGYEAVINEWKNRRSRKVNPVVLSCGDCSRTTVCCCLSGATPYTHSSPILTQLLHRGFFSQHWNRVSKDAFAKQLPCSCYLDFARLAH